MTEERNFIAENIRSLRERTGFSQQQVADYLGITHHTTISYYETGKREIPMELLEKLADLFRVDLYDLLEEDATAQTVNIAFAYRAEDLDAKDVKAISQFNKLVKNYLKIKRLQNNATK